MVNAEIPHHDTEGNGHSLRRLSLRFVGEVQGVGFRWTASNTARLADTTGWVKNERDGSVSMELQGTDEQIATFFGAFGRAYVHYPIDYVIDEKNEIPVVVEEHEFRVRF